MFLKTNSEYAPWKIIDSNNKLEARINSIKHVLSKFKNFKKPLHSTEKPKYIKKEKQVNFSKKDLKFLNKNKGLIDLLSRDNTSLSKTLRYVKFERDLKKLQTEMIKLQNWVSEKNKKIVILFEGRDSAGKGGAIRRTIQNLNPRKLKVVALPKPSMSEEGQWYFQRYVEHFPKNGEIVFFDRSWYNRAVVEPVNGFCSKEQYENFMRHVNDFEKMIIDDNILLLKFYFSISKETQKKRFKEIKNSSLKKWKFTDVDSKGQVYSYIELTGSGIIYPGLTLFANADEVTNVSQWWISWNNGGGMLNPFGEGMLKGGGDICRWALLTAGVEVDYGAWGNAAIVLNGYEFAGYINDAEVTAWDWVSSNILPFLPVEVKAGVKGIKPILALVFASTYLQPSTKITATSDFIQVSAIETMQDTTELLNSVTIRFGKNGFDQDMSMIARVGPNAANDSQDRDDIYSSTSFNRYGLLESAIESDYIYDRNTAFYIAHTMVKAKAFPMLSISYEASNNFGYLQVGDLIQITDSNLYLEEAYATVLAKEWRGDVWGYIIGISSAAITLPRTT